MKLTERSIRSITEDFYSEFCGENLREVTKGCYFDVYRRRNDELALSGRKYTIYTIVRDDLCVVAYAPQYEAFVGGLRGKSTDEILAALKGYFHIREQQLMLFQGERIQDYGSARLLMPADYPLFETFFRMTHMGSKPPIWMQGHFEYNAEKGYIAGTFVNGRLVSFCDTPDMPYLQGLIQYTDVATLPEE